VIAIAVDICIFFGGQLWLNGSSAGSLLGDRGATIRAKGEALVSDSYANGSSSYGKS